MYLKNLSTFFIILYLLLALVTCDNYVVDEPTSCEGREAK